MEIGSYTMFTYTQGELMFILRTYTLSLFYGINTAPNSQFLDIYIYVLFICILFRKQRKVYIHKSQKKFFR